MTFETHCTALDALNDLLERYDDKDVAEYLFTDDYHRLVDAHDAFALRLVDYEDMETAHSACETRLREIAEGDDFDGKAEAEADLRTAIAELYRLTSNV